MLTSSDKLDPAPQLQLFHQLLPLLLHGRLASSLLASGDLQPLAAAPQSCHTGRS